MSEEWPRERFFRRGGNAAVIRQELESEHGVVVMRREAYVGVPVAKGEHRRTPLIG
jgi:hypothetical protein